MSGILKGIGKVFRKVIKVAKKVLPYALIGAAAIFTGGAALGVLPAFGTAVGGVVSSLGLGSTLGPILTGAITKAGIGGLAGLAVGGKKGMMTGLMAGAVMGGAGAALGGGAAAAGGAAAPAQNLTGSLTGFTTPAEQFVGGAASAAPTVAAAVPTLAAPVASGGGLGGLLGNQTFMSQAIQGLGNGLMQRSQMRAEERAREKEAENYSVAGGLLDPSNMNGGGGGASYDSQLKWVYDPRQQKLVRG